MGNLTLKAVAARSAGSINILAYQDGGAASERSLVQRYRPIFWRASAGNVAPLALVLRGEGLGVRGLATAVRLNAQTRPFSSRF